MVLAKPGSIKPHRKFKSEVYVLKKEEGGRHKAFFSGYKPQFYIRTLDVTGEITLPAGVDAVHVLHLDDAEQLAQRLVGEAGETRPLAAHH